ncbi:Sensor histidine kinase RcsC [subsurface metagenome]
MTPNKENKSVSQYSFQPIAKPGLTDNFLTSIRNDRKGDLWIGTRGGLFKYDITNEYFERFYGNEDIYEIDKIGWIEFDLHNNLWVGTEEGLYKIIPTESGSIDLDNIRIKHFLNNPGDSLSISGNWITTMCIDRGNNLWVGTYGSGLNKLSAESNSKNEEVFIHYSENDGLSNNTIYGILTDQSDNLWISTDYGLSKFVTKSKRFYKYLQSDGLLSSQFYWSACHKNNEGKMYFGGINGMNAFYPDRIVEQSPVVKPVITEFKILNQNVEAGSIIFHREVMKKSINCVSKITLSHKVKEFSFEFSSLSYEDPEKIQYAYMLKGFDENWNYLNFKRRHISFTNLKGGEYKLLVRAGIENQWNTEPLQLDIIIIPPIWARAWFITLTVFILIASVIGYNRYRVYELRKNKKELEILVKQRTAEVEAQKIKLKKQNIDIGSQRDKLMQLNKKMHLANQQQMRFFTHISHEFKAPLTLIISPIEQIIREMNLNSIYYEKLQTVKRNAKILLHLINQLLEVRKMKTANMGLKVHKSDIILFLEGIVHSFELLAKKKNIQFDFIFYPDTIKVFFDGDKVENICYNLLSNAFKYTPENGRVTVQVSLTGQENIQEGDVCIAGVNPKKKNNANEYVEILIQDSGSGIPNDQLKDIFKRFYSGYSPNIAVQGSGLGLYLTKELIKIHNGVLIVNSDVGKGTVFKVRLPVVKEYSGSQIADSLESSKTMMNQKLHVDLLSEQINIPDNGGNMHKELSLLSESNSKPTLLIVDDNEDFLLYIKNNLSSSFKIITARNGKEGLSKLNLNTIDAVILDVVMPEMDGLEFCQSIKSNIMHSHIPVIIVSSRSDINDYVNGLKIGADDYLSKPFDLELLASKINSLIKNRIKLRKIFSSSLFNDIQKASNNQKGTELLTRIINIVDKNIANPEFGVNELANALGMSHSLLQKTLKSLVNQSPHDFINSIRLKKSAMLLMDGYMTVSQVAFQIGFNDPKYFSRRFSKFFGKPPSDYLTPVN